MPPVIQWGLRRAPGVHVVVEGDLSLGDPLNRKHGWPLRFPAGGDDPEFNEPWATAVDCRVQIVYSPFERPCIHFPYGSFSSRFFADGLPMRSIILTLATVLVLLDDAMAGLTVSTDFEGGSAVVVSLDARNQSLHIQPKVVHERGFPCWWYCRLDGLSVGKPVKFTVSANPAPFRGQQVLSHTWLLPDRASITSDNSVWQHTRLAEFKNKTATYTFDATAETMWVAWGPPLLASHSEKFLANVAKELPGAEVFKLARTRAGRPVSAIRLGARPKDRLKPFGIWIQARQHAWEAGSSWVAKGFLEWASSDDPIAVQLRKKAAIYVVPIMDVDSVTDGVGGKTAVPRDHNRDWDDEPIYPEVRAAQTMIRQLDENCRFDVFVDLHNPGPIDRKPFFFGPMIEELSEIQQRNFVRWKAVAHSLIEQLEPEYRFASYVKTQEERDRVSSNWVRNHTSAHVVAMTLETSWNRPEGTQQGYQRVGNQLGLTIARYLTMDPRAE